MFQITVLSLSLWFFDGNWCLKDKVRVLGPGFGLLWPWNTHPRPC